MNSGRTIFSQVLDHLPWYEFQKCVTRYRGDYQQKSFSCWDQYLCMSFAQLTYRESLRDIEACLRSMSPKLYHMGLRGRVARSTLADANEARDWRIYADFAQVLIAIARPLYSHDPIGVDLDQNLYALDSTTIDLCLSLFPWAKFRKTKGAVKMHTLLDVLRDTHQGERAAPAALLAPGRQDHRRAVGSDRDSDCDRLGHGVSRPVAANHLRRCRDQQTAGLLNEQLRASGTYNRTDLQIALANRTVLQVD